MLPAWMVRPICRMQIAPIRVLGSGRPSLSRRSRTSFAALTGTERPRRARPEPAPVRDRIGRPADTLRLSRRSARRPVALQLGRPASLADPRRVHSKSSNDVACRPATHQARRSG